MRPAEGDVLARAHFAVRERPDLTRRGDEYRPVKVRLGAVVDEDVGISLALGSRERERWIELKHGAPLVDAASAARQGCAPVQ